MGKEIGAATWVYAFVQNPGADEKIVGQHDLEQDVAFIPAFLDKESAQQGIIQMPCEKGNKYEVQAIIYEDLANYAAANNFLIFILNAEGKVIQKIAP